MAISNRRALACERRLAVFRRRETQAGGQVFSQSTVFVGLPLKLDINDETAENRHQCVTEFSVSDAGP